MSASAVAAGNEGLGKISPSPSSTLSETNSANELKAHDYIGLSETASSVESSCAKTNATSADDNNLNLRETELRLGLPGSQSPLRDSDETQLSLMSSAPLVRSDVQVKQLFPFEESPAEVKNGQEKVSGVKSAGLGRSVTGISGKNGVSGAKRGFTEAMEPRNSYASADGNWVFSAQAGSDAELPKSTGPQSKFGVSSVSNWHTGVLDQSGNSFISSRPPPATNIKDISQAQERTRTDTSNPSKMKPANHSASASAMSLAAKQQVVGWPPIRNFRKNTLAVAPSACEECEEKPGGSALYVKVSMDGAPYLRKVDLKLNNSYPQLSSALEKMFSCFTLGQCGSHSNRDGLNESKLMDLLHGSEYVLAYEDKDGDWMLVGDVPWEMFSASCRRLRIMKGSEAIGLAPRAMEKCRNRN
eukprot:TRINITY_DN5023_c0_g1_i1.p1 TRINITY_DN5023_c0_g1~~TRINITY_DN5023_c0_g1_i1.p1  ORF type:complete len:415 (+),score=67.02 TRINITY_DN5023_c0_g1_i1:128-1372(+)